MADQNQPPTPNNQNGQPLTRQQLYERVRQVGKEEFVISEMKRLGFWDVSVGVPKEHEQLREERSKLYTELSELNQKQAVYKNKNKMLREMRKKRMSEAKERREETKQKREQRRIGKVQAWSEKQNTDIVYLGEGFSAGLNNKASNLTQLEVFGLPIFQNVVELAEGMKLSLKEIRFLAYHRKVARTKHYKKFTIPKKTGGVRTISAPMMRLKVAQYWILENILYKLDIHEMAHGFIPKKSIITNAEKHLGSDVVINLDIKDFFPSITYLRVKGVFQVLGYSEQLATIFALICTEANTKEVMLDGIRYYVAEGERVLPQGAPTSPAITNILCHGLDMRFAGMAKQMGWTYTRYADDLTFSKKESNGEDINRILWQAKQIITDEGFAIHPAKIHIMRKGSRQEVTGIVVNEKINISREKLKQFRAAIHHLRTKGLDGLAWGNGANVLRSMIGFANYVNMVNPEKGQAWLTELKEILSQPAFAEKIKTAKKENIGKSEAKEEVKIEEKETMQDISEPNTLNDDVSPDWWQLW